MRRHAVQVAYKSRTEDFTMARLIDSYYTLYIGHAKFKNTKQDLP